MAANETPRILVCAGRAETLADVRGTLAAGGHPAEGHLLGGTDPDRPHEFALVVVEGGDDAGPALGLVRRLRGRLDDGVVPILYVTTDAGPDARLAGLESGADAYLLRPFAPAELLAQVRAFLRIKETHDRLADKTAEVHRVNKRLQEAYHQIDQELELAQRLQASFLPRSLPQVPGARFAVHYRLSGRVGGDFYDAFRLDEHHVGFYVADAMGHGVPAGLLTIFVKKGIRAKEVFGNQYRLVPPGEVLQGLNKELIDQHLSESPFITMAYGLLDQRDGTVRLGRAGHPFPLHVPREGAVTPCRQEGLLLGVADAAFATRDVALAPGDKLLVFSDGIDSATCEGRPPGTESLLAHVERHRALPVQAFVDQLARDLFGGADHPDDLTLLALERTG